MKEFTKEQLEYILQWLNSWEQLKGTAIPIRFKEVFMKPESAIDHERIKLSDVQISTSGELALFLRFLNQRDCIIQRCQYYPRSQFPVEEIEYCNKQMKSILNL